MVGLVIKKFAGVVPVTGDRALPDGFAVKSVNTWLYSQELRGINVETQLLTVNPTTQKVFRVPKGTPGGDANWPWHVEQPTTIPRPSYLGDSTWLQFDDPDTDVVKGPLIEDRWDRWYFCSPSDGISMNTQDRMEKAQPGYLLGVDAPVTAVTISGAGTSTQTMETRAYVYTYQSIYGEQSAPSPAAVASWYPEQIWNIGNLPSVPANGPGKVPLKYLILYRTLQGAYFEVKKWEIGVDVIPDPFPDNIPNTTIASHNQLETIGWLPPPVFKAGDPNATPPTTDEQGLKGILAMPNGFLIGFTDTDLWMSVPYQPHAWPREYVVSTEYPIVGIGLVGNTCVVCTQGYPTAITGVNPASTSFTKLNTVEPCLSRGSIVSTLYGVYYASQNGLIGVNTGGVENVTQDIITRESWIRYYSPEYIRGVRYQNGYFAVRVQPDSSQATGFYFDPSKMEVALTEFDNFEDSKNLVSDVWSGEVFHIRGGAVYRWDPPTDDMMPIIWRTKEYQLQYEINLGCYSIYWDQARFAPNDINTSIIPRDVPVRFLAWCNRRLVYDQNIPINRNGKSMRLPSGFMGDIWQFEVRARAPVYSIAVAQTERELRGA